MTLHRFQPPGEIALNRLLALAATTFLVLSAGAAHAADPAKTTATATAQKPAATPASAPASAPKKKEKKGGC
jgi:hypothetical protein